MATATVTDAQILRSTPVRNVLVDTKVFKAWARKNGFSVTEGRGRVANEAIDAYNLNPANRRAGRQYVPGEAKPQPGVTYTYNWTDARGRVRQATFTAPPSAVRAFAAENGLTVAARDRFPQSVLDAYGQAERAAKPSRSRKAKADASE